MGKWTKLKKELARFQQPEEYQQRVDKAKLPYLNLGMIKLAEKFSDWKDRKDEINDRLKEANLELEALIQVLVAKMEDDNVTKFQTGEGLSIFIKDEPYCSTQNREELHEWVRKEGLHDLFVVNHQTLTAMVKEKLERGEELPPGVAIYMKTSIQRRDSNT